MTSLLSLHWDSGQNIWYLDGPVGQTIQFTDEAAVDAFVNAMTAGENVFLGTILQGNIFPSITAGNMDAVDRFYYDYMQSSNALMVEGSEEEFLASSYEVETIADCLIQAVAAAKGKTIKSPTKTQREDLRRFRIAMQDPEKRAEAIQIQKEFKAQLSARADKPSEQKESGTAVTASAPDYAQTWFNLTGGQMLTLNEQFLNPESIMYVSSYPANQFQIGQQSLAWSWIASGWAQGEMDGGVVWNLPNGQWAGVNVHVPAQFLGVGTAPYYQVSWSEDGKSDWFTPVSDPAMPFQFPTSLGYTINIQTACGHASIAVSITVGK